MILPDPRLTRTRKTPCLRQRGSIVVGIGVVPDECASKTLKSSPRKDMDPLVDCNMEGINEKGRAAHLLYLHVTKYEERDVRKPGITNLRWLRHVLDSFNTVNYH